jgi:hypothetical protein
VGNGPSVTAVRLCRRCSNDEAPMIMPSLCSAFSWEWRTSQRSAMEIDGMNAALPQQGFVRGADATLERCWVPPEPNGINVPKWKCHDHLGTEGPS